jgi:hypothetical protein
MRHVHPSINTLQVGLARIEALAVHGLGPHAEVDVRIGLVK